MRTAYTSLHDNGWSGFETVQRMRREGMKENHLADIAQALMRYVSYTEYHTGRAERDQLELLDGAIAELQRAWREANGLNDDP